MKRKQPCISIITPCYNHGLFLAEARDSINLAKHESIFEWIIVNDGSTDIETLNTLNDLEEQGFQIIHQANKGLGAARNIGIKYSIGKYILPLDSDNKIEPETFIEALNIMNSNPQISVIYTDALYFGEKTGKWKVGNYDKFKLFDSNYIDACALIRKEALMNVGCYDENMPKMGNEDWELWINMLSNNHEFLYLPKIGFHYRVRSNSMVNIITNISYNENKTYIYNKHINTTVKLYSELFNTKNKIITNINKKISKNKLKSIIKIIIGRKLF